MDMGIGLNSKNILDMKSSFENRTLNGSNENSKFVQIYNQMANKNKSAAQNQDNVVSQNDSKLQSNTSKFVKKEEKPAEKLALFEKKPEANIFVEEENYEDLFIALEELVKILDALIETKTAVSETSIADKPLKETELLNLLDQLKELVKYKGDVDLSDSDIKSEFSEKVETVLNKLKELNSIDLPKNEEIKALANKIESNFKNLGFIETSNNENLKLTHQIYQRMKSAVILKSEETQVDANKKANDNLNSNVLNKNHVEIKSEVDVKTDLSSDDSEGKEELNSGKTDTKLVGNISAETKADITFINKVENAEMLKNTDTQQIIDQINKNLKSIKLLNGSQEIKIMLKPEALGEVNLKMILDKGLITAKLVVESSLVKEAIDKQLGTLKETLQNQGYEIKEFKIVVKTPEGEILNFEDGNQSSGKHKRQQKNSEKNTDESFEDYFENKQFEINI